MLPITVSFWMTNKHPITTNDIGDKCKIFFFSTMKGAYEELKKIHWMSLKTLLTV